jgi:hypothetical protein
MVYLDLMFMGLDILGQQLFQLRFIHFWVIGHIEPHHGDRFIGFDINFLKIELKLLSGLEHITLVSSRFKFRNNQNFRSLFNGLLFKGLFQRKLRSKVNQTDLTQELVELLLNDVLNRFLNNLIFFDFNSLLDSIALVVIEIFQSNVHLRFLWIRIEDCVNDRIRP